MIGFVINLFLVLILGIIQVSFLSTWPWPVSSLNLILSLVIFFAVISSYKKSLWLAFGSGLFLEVYSGLYFGVTVFSLILTVIIINLLFNNFFTNRSYYSLVILGIIGTVAYNLIILVSSWFVYLVKLSQTVIALDFWSQFFWQSIFNLIILTIIFYAYHISSNRLKSVFLFPTSYYENKNGR
jgi:hypothetical protein